MRWIGSWPCGRLRRIRTFIIPSVAPWWRRICLGREMVWMFFESWSGNSIDTTTSRFLGLRFAAHSRNDEFERDESDPLLSMIRQYEFEADVTTKEFDLSMMTCANARRIYQIYIYLLAVHI